MKHIFKSRFYSLIPVMLLFLSLSLSSYKKFSDSEDIKEADKVRVAFNEFIHSIESGNVDGYFKYITSDFIGYDAGRGPITNMNELRTELEGLFLSHTFKLTNYESQEVIIRDDIAIHRHKGLIVLQSKADGNAIELDVKYLDVMKKDNEGNWKLYIHSVSPNN